MPRAFPFAIALGSALCLLPLAPIGAAAPESAHFLPGDAIDLRALLGDPPAAGTPANDADLKAVLARQSTRTPADVARARARESLAPAVFTDAVGDWFTPDKLPLTFALLDHAADEAKALSTRAQLLWGRDRPPLQDTTIQPATNVPGAPSYPSTHATQGLLWALILGEIAPDRKERIMARGLQIGEDGVTAGVQFPTDVAAGQKLARALWERLLATPAFAAELKAAQDEALQARPPADPAAQ